MTPEPTKEQRDIANVALDCCRDYVTFAMIADVPSGPNSRVHNSATCSFIDTGHAKIGVTNQHVLEAYRKQKLTKPNVRFQLGSLVFDAEERLIDEHVNHDLAVFSVDEACVSRLKKQFCSCSSWPPQRARVSEIALLAGYPGIFRQQVSNQDVLFEVVLLLEVVKSSSDEHFTIFLDKANWTKQSGRRKISDLKNLGGFSGSSVFRLVEDELGAVVEPVGIVFEALSEFGLFRARHMDLIKPDGSIG